jgi:hypothetical protein
LKAALKYSGLSLIASPVLKHRKFLGNMGKGTNKDAVVNIRKIIRIGAPPTVDIPQRF